MLGFRHYLLGVLLAATCSSIICGAACDWIEPGECLAPGEMFGPCINGSCSPDLHCLITAKGDMCLPGADAADDWDANKCASWRGDMACSKDQDQCFLACDGPGDCKGGTSCDEALGKCVYPKPPVCDPTKIGECPDGETCEGGKCVPEVEMCLQLGDAFGPCLDGGCKAGLFCRNGAEGSICLPPCDADGCASNCAAAFGTACDHSGICNQPCDTGCVNGQVCDPGLGHCVWPSGECGGDGGLYGPCVDHGCVDGLTCFSGLAGEMCVTTSPAGEAEELCAAPIGGAGISTEEHFYGAYMIRCQNDADCGAGTVCEELYGICLHPYGPYNVQPLPGFGLGPCDKELPSGCGYHLDTCVAVDEGSMCIRKDNPEWLIDCAADDDCVNGQVCGVDVGFCVWPWG